MKFYSETTGELYDNVEELKKAESAFNDRSAQKEKSREEYESAMDKAVQAFMDALAKYSALRDLEEEDEDDNLNIIFKLLGA